MNLLSMLSAMLATAFLIGGIYCLTRNRKSVLNVFSFLVLISLGWWSFCYAFFFSAQTQQELWLWHRLGAVGWTGFIPFTTYYFIVLTGLRDKFKVLWKQVLFYAPPIILLAYNLFGDTTCLAQAFVRSGLFGQWTYVNSPSNLWFWIYIVCLACYFAMAFLLLLKWSSTVKHRLKKRMAIGFVLIDALTVLFGLVTDGIIPMTSQAIPAIANLGTALFGAGYFLVIIRFDLFNLHLVVSDREIIEHTTDAVLLMDEAGEILYVNSAGSQLIEQERAKLMGGRLADVLGMEQYQEKFALLPSKLDYLNDVELSMTTAKGNDKRLLMSCAVIRDSQKEYLGTVVSFRDITQLSRLKEQYRIQSDRFEKMAFVDTLTGLPNRRKTFEVLGERAGKYQAQQKDFFILYMDLDRFKSINDLYGHNAGDQLLIDVAKRLNECLFGQLNFLGRLSGDELMMIGGEDTSEQAIIACVERIKALFVKPFQIGGHTIQSSISVGYARYSDHGDVDDMVHHADEHMYGEKQVTHTKTRKSAR